MAFVEEGVIRRNTTDNRYSAILKLWNGRILEGDIGEDAEKDIVGDLGTQDAQPETKTSMLRESSDEDDYNGNSKLLRNSQERDINKSNSLVDSAGVRYRAFTEYDLKRCSLYTDQGYVKMGTLERFGMSSANRISTVRDSICSVNSTDSDVQFDDKMEGYMRMKPLYFNNHKSNTKAFKTFEHFSQSSNGKIATLDFRQFTSNRSLNTKGSYTLGQNTNNKSLTLNKQANTLPRKQVSLYDRLMKEVLEKIPAQNSSQFSETELADKYYFNSMESRIVYHTLRGWKPNTSFCEKAWEQKFPEDLSVNEVYIFILRQGNSRLAEYLRKYHIDGYLLHELLKDDLLLDDRLFNNSFISVIELRNLRLYFYPQRPRCNAVDERKNTVVTI